jgi:hypothetical protein
MGGAGSCTPGVLQGNISDAVGMDLACSVPRALPKTTIQTSLPCCDIYANNQGEVPGDGTAQNPYTSLDNAINMATNGKTICLRTSGDPYTAGVALPGGVSLLGGFDADWKRPDPTTYPFIEAMASASIISGSPLADPINGVMAALVVNGSGMDALIDGIQFQGPAQVAPFGGAAAVGVLLMECGSKLTFSNNKVQGGSTASVPASGQPVAAAGLMIVNGSPIIQLNQIMGSASQQQTNAPTSSVGVALLGQGMTTLQGNKITGGAGQNDSKGNPAKENSQGSVGVLVAAMSSALQATMTHNQIDGGTGSCPGGFAHVGVAIVDQAQAVLTSNYVSGSGLSGDNDASQGSSVGVLHSSAASLNIQLNRVHGGDGALLNRTVGVEIGKATGGTLAGNMIHGGRTGTGLSEGVAQLAGSSNLLIHYNTVYSGHQSNQAMPSTTLAISGGTSTKIEANLLLAGGDASLAFALQQSAIATFAANIMLGVGVNVGQVNGSAIATVNDANYPNNFVVRGTCPQGQMNCVTTTDCTGTVTPACLLGCWGSDEGVSALREAGWQISENNPGNLSCPILGKFGPVNTVNLQTPPKTDMYGSQYPVGVAMEDPTTGAFQYTVQGGCLTPPKPQ